MKSVVPFRFCKGFSEKLPSKNLKKPAKITSNFPGSVYRIAITSAIGGERRVSSFKSEIHEIGLIWSILRR